MNSVSNPTPSISETFASEIVVGEPQSAGNLAVFPLFYKGADVEYTSLASADGSVTIGEHAEGASVESLTVMNEGTGRVLLYEGEELLGAQQNRVVDLSILLAAGTKTSIPVSCVERGRWDGSRHRESFRRGGRTADADLRRKKKQAMLMQATRGMEARSSQAEVWATVDERQAELGAASPTDSLSDVFDQRRNQTEAIRLAIEPLDGQCGMVAAIDGEIAICDLVSRPEVFADLHPALVEGYALDVSAGARLRRLRRQTQRPFAASPSFLVADATASSTQALAGIGETRYFSTAGVAGSALSFEGELIQLSAYPQSGGGDALGARTGSPRRGRINRPSRRRQA